MFFVVWLNESFNFPLGWIKYIVTVISFNIIFTLPRVWKEKSCKLQTEGNGQRNTIWTHPLLLGCHVTFCIKSDSLCSHRWHVFVEFNIPGHLSSRVSLEGNWCQVLNVGRLTTSPFIWTVRTVGVPITLPGLGNAVVGVVALKLWSHVTRHVCQNKQDKEQLHVSTDTLNKWSKAQIDSKCLIHNKMCIVTKKKDYPPDNAVTLINSPDNAVTLINSSDNAVTLINSSDNAVTLTLLTMLWPWLTLLTMLWPWLTLLPMLCLWDLGHSQQKWWISKASINFVRSKSTIPLECMCV